MRIGRRCHWICVVGGVWAAVGGVSAGVCADAPGTQPVAAAATMPAGQKGKPSLSLLADGFPEGHDSPEGAACDLARAFIEKKPELFRESCLPAFGGGSGRKAYEDFLERAEAGVKAEGAKADASPHGPKVIAKVFAARHLTLEGPASYGYAVFGFNDVMFVDVGVIENSGKKMLCRTLVIQNSAGKWFVDPDPEAHPLLGAGLNEEKGSTQDFSEAYTVQK
jgi:hypothetical protein